MTTEGKICCVIGDLQLYSFHTASSFQKLAKERLYRLFSGLIKWGNVSHFVIAMLSDTELLSMGLILDLKKQYPYITLEAIIPYLSLPADCSPKYQAFYYYLQNHCDKTTIIHRLHTPSSIDIQYEYMVNCADLILAIWDGSKGDIGNAVEYARFIDTDLLIFDPAGSTISSYLSFSCRGCEDKSRVKCYNECK